MHSYDIAAAVATERVNGLHAAAAEARLVKQRPASRAAPA
jgi:hypothetical protein